MINVRKSYHRCGQARFCCAEHLLKSLPQRDVDIRHGREVTEIGEAGDTKARVGDAAGDDRVKVREIRLDVDGNAVERHPAPEPHADRSNLVLEVYALVRPPDPDADTVLATLAATLNAQSVRMIHCSRPAT